MRRLALASLLMLFAVSQAAAERLVVSLSNRRVAVTSSFTGEDLVLFGTIEADTPQAALRPPYDLVVTVAGPRGSMRTRRTERRLGVWINTDTREFVRAPSYLSVLSNRPVNEIAAQDRLRRLQLGLDNFLLPQRFGSDIGDSARDDPFRLAFVRLETQLGLYQQSDKAVTFLTPTVFRAAIPLPANAPTGSYSMDVRLFAAGVPVGNAQSSLDVIKTGVEQYVADAARDHGLVYGLATALMALLIGWFGSVVFRRD